MIDFFKAQREEQEESMRLRQISKKGCACAGLLLGLIFTLLCVLASGCGRIEGTVADTADDTRPVEGVYTIFYTNLDRNQLVRRKYTPTSEKFEGILNELLEAFLNPPDEEACSAIPDTVRINQTSMGIDEIDVDFSPEYLSLNAVQEVLLRAGLVRTLIQLPGVYTVRFTVDGQALIIGGEEIGPMGEDTFIVPVSGAINSYRYTEIPLYFSNKNGKKLVRELRNVYYSSNLNTERLVIEQILKGPQRKKLLPVADPGTLLRSVDIVDGICTIDFSASIENLPSSDSPVEPETTIYAFVNSIFDSCEDQDLVGVRFMIDGKSGGRFRGQVNLDQTFVRSSEIISDTSNLFVTNGGVVEQEELPEIKETDSSSGQEEQETQTQDDQGRETSQDDPDEKASQEKDGREADTQEVRGESEDTSADAASAEQGQAEQGQAEQGQAEQNQADQGQAEQQEAQAEQQEAQADQGQAEQQEAPTDQGQADPAQDGQNAEAASAEESGQAENAGQAGAADGSADASAGLVNVKDSSTDFGLQAGINTLGAKNLVSAMTTDLVLNLD